MPLQLVITRIGSQVSESEDEDDQSAGPAALTMDDVFVKAISNDLANEVLRRTIRPVDEIKMYRVANSASKQLPVAGQSGIQDKRVTAAAGRRLVGAEYTRHLLIEEENRLSFEVSRRKVHQAIKQDFKRDLAELSADLGTLLTITEKSKGDSNTANPTCLDRQRKSLIQASNERRMLLSAHPQRLGDFTTPRPNLDFAEWVLLRNSMLDMETVENGLFNVELAEEPATDSSDDESPKKSGKVRRNTVMAAKRFANKGLAYNMLDTDVTARLRADLDNLDRSLLKEYQRRQRSSQRSKRGLPDFHMTNKLGSSVAAGDAVGTIHKATAPASGKDNQHHHPECITHKHTQTPIPTIQSAHCHYAQDAAIASTVVAPIVGRPTPPTTPISSSRRPQGQRIIVQAAAISPESSYDAEDFLESVRGSDESCPKLHAPLEERQRKFDIVASTIDEIQQNRQKKIGKVVDSKIEGEPAHGTDASTTMYFVSPVQTVAARPGAHGHLDWQRPMPYRDREKRVLVQANSNLHSSSANANEDVVCELTARGVVPPDLATAVHTIGLSSSAVNTARTARIVVCEDMKAIKEHCQEVAARGCNQVGKLVALCRDLADEKQRDRQAVVVDLQGKELALPHDLVNRRQQLAEFDSQQSMLLDHSVVADVANSRASEISSTVPQVSSFITQMSPWQQHATKPQLLWQSGHHSDTAKRRASQQGKAPPVANDFNLMYNYNGYLEGVQRQQKEATGRDEHERLSRKGWFLQLLRKVKSYKKSASYARVPTSLIVLLAALKDLICMGVELTKESVWQLIDRTIHVDEHKSNIVYTSLQHVFDAVGISCAEVYDCLKERGIEPAPKLVAILRKHRAKQLQDKLKYDAKVAARERRVMGLQAKAVAAFMGGLRDKQAREEDARRTIAEHLVKMVQSRVAPVTVAPVTVAPTTDDNFEQLDIAAFMNE